jgi:hypothetical protein
MEQAWVLTEDEALELVAFLVTAARTQVDEAAEYGPMRLMMAANRLMEAACSRVSAPAREFLTSAIACVPQLATPMSASEDYVERLDALCSALAVYLAGRYDRGSTRS